MLCVSYTLHSQWNAAHSVIYFCLLPGCSNPVTKILDWLPVPQQGVISSFSSDDCGPSAASERQEADDEFGNGSTHTQHAQSAWYHLNLTSWQLSEAFLLFIWSPSPRSWTALLFSFDIHHKHQHKYSIHIFPLKIKKNWKCKEVDL